MSWWRDVIDWVGGYPYESAPAQAIEGFYGARGFRLQKRTVTDGHGCNQFVFVAAG